MTKVHGTPEERRCLVNVYQITYSDLHINVVFRKVTPLKHKLWIRQWLIANNFSFRDKPYVWKEGVSTSTKQIGLGPWSKKPWANGKNAHSTKATWNQK